MAVVVNQSRADLKNASEQKAQALSIIKEAAGSSSKVVSAAGKKIISAMEEGKLSEDAIRSLSSGTFSETYQFDKDGKWVHFRHSKAWKAAVDKRQKDETEIFNLLAQTLSAQFESGGLKAVFQAMQEMNGHVSYVALSHLDSDVNRVIANTDRLVGALAHTSVKWHRAALTEQKRFQAHLRSHEGAKEIDALLNPKTNAPAAKKTAVKKAKA
jgi:hypothetical protein